MECGRCGTEHTVSSSRPEPSPVVNSAQLERAFSYLKTDEGYLAVKILESLVQENPRNAKAYVGIFMAYNGIRHEDEIAIGENAYRAYLDENFRKAFDVADSVYFEVLKGYLYRGACVLMQPGSYADALDLFELFPEFKDSNEKIVKCSEALYAEGCDLLNSERYNEAKSKFSRIPEFNDASSQISRCTEIIDKKERGDERSWRVFGTFFFSIFSVPICGVIGLFISFILNIANGISTGRGFKVWDWDICLTVGIIGCILGVVVAYLIARNA